MSAANNIEAHSKSLKGLLKERKYTVKYFQREYKWDKTHIEDLLVDLERSFMSNYRVEHTREDVPEYDCYYMGPIVLYREKSTYIIVDGQQRLTSFTLLLIYLNELQRITFGPNAKKIQNLNEYIYSQPYERETFNLEIKEREPILRCLYERKEIKDEFLVSESSQNIFERYHDIVNLFPKILSKEEVLPIFINWLVEKLIFIEIMAQSSDSAYTIFETMNDRGLNLTQSELLKSYLLSNVNDEVKIKELDLAWKRKIIQLKSYSNDEDQDFCKAWMRAKFAQTLKLNENNKTKEDFEKIGNRYSNWVQENEKRLLHLDKNDPNTFYYFVKSDFHFFSNVYIKLCEYETSLTSPEHVFRLMSYKGISQSLSYPFVLAPILQSDESDIIEQKIDMCVNYLDAFAIYRLFGDLPITQSSVDYAIYSKIKRIRNKSLEEVGEILRPEIEEYRKNFIKMHNHLSFDPSYSKYILARLIKLTKPDVEFEALYFMRKKDSYLIYHLFDTTTVDNELGTFNAALLKRLSESLSSFCLIPRSLESKLNSMSVRNKIELLISNKLLPELLDDSEIGTLRDFFLKRDKKLKELIFNTWKVK